MARDTTHHHPSQYATCAKTACLGRKKLWETGIAGGVADIDRVVWLIEERGSTIWDEHAALVVRSTDGNLHVTNTAQVRVERTLAVQVKKGRRLGQPS